MNEFVRQARKGIGLELQSMQGSRTGIGKHEPQKSHFRPRQGQVAFRTTRIGHAARKRPCAAISGTLHFKISRHTNILPLDEQPAKTMRSSKINHPPWRGIRLIRLPNSVLFLRQDRCSVCATGCLHFERQTQRLILHPRMANFQHATTTFRRGHHKLHSADHRRRAATGRAPRKRHVALTDSASQPFIVQDQAFTTIAPYILPKVVGQLELKIICRPRALEIEPQFVGLRHRQFQLPPQGHKSTTFVEIVLQPQPAALTPTYPSLRVTRRKNLPGFGVFKEGNNGFFSSHGKFFTD